ncbi:GNAT family N-acetyltransferase [Flavobacterium sp.]|jgi:ribosomal protein S18 acetylase RimI-like enzyme|uniref:GNAT family N-acetyltransferase n=1 Tax=Flavobacterium sp. TaxID=239 RepID=UPI0022C10CE9|nr:GNAT family N-acetyltransferase [Flavobacterium sp.]MCZ8230357.1 GNAT family N-acetyltransferase [Flavobacterium sp.]
MIRKATLHDLDALTDLFDQYLVFYKKPSNIENHKAFLKERLENHEAEVFLAFDEQNKAIGFALNYITFSSLLLKKIVILNDIFVNPSTRKSGVASKLIEETKKLAQDLGSPIIRLRTAKNNFTAQKLYHKMGFIRDEHLYGYDLILEK